MGIKKVFYFDDEGYIKLNDLIDFASQDKNDKIEIRGRRYQSFPHAHWEALYAHEEPTSNVYRCSNCGKGFADYFDDDYDYYNEYPVFFEYDRCPHCGAIMDSDTVYPTYRPDGKYSESWRSQQSFIVDNEIDDVAVDTEDIKHGHWEAYDMSIKDVPVEACSICGKWSYGYRERYCPKCGAKMDDGVEK